MCLAKIKENLFQKSDLSTWFLIISNLSAILGVIFFGWTWQSVLLVYWFESAIIGFFTLVKIFIITVIIIEPKGPIKASDVFKPGVKAELIKPGILIRLVAFPFVSALLLLPVGIFMAGLLELLVPMINIGTPWAVFMDKQAADVSLGNVLNSLVPMLPLILFLFISHAVSLFVNYIGKKEYANFESSIIGTLIILWCRIIAMMITLSFGVLFLISLHIAFGVGESSIAILLVLVKIGIDLMVHNEEHKMAQSKKHSHHKR